MQYSDAQASDGWTKCIMDTIFELKTELSSSFYDIIDQFITESI
ncbi:MAG: hypothetical protein ACXAB7_09040 [Candidatus Kariarchaeaceae archaeon]